MEKFVYLVKLLEDPKGGYKVEIPYLPLYRGKINTISEITNEIQEAIDKYAGPKKDIPYEIRVVIME